MIVMIQALHKVSKTNFSKALGCSFKKVTRLLVPLYARGQCVGTMFTKQLACSFVPCYSALLILSVRARARLERSGLSST